MHGTHRHQHTTTNTKLAHNNSFKSYERDAFSMAHSATLSVTMNFPRLPHALWLFSQHNQKCDPLIFFPFFRSVSFVISQKWKIKPHKCSSSWRKASARSHSRQIIRQFVRTWFRKYWNNVKKDSSPIFPFQPGLRVSERRSRVFPLLISCVFFIVACDSFRVIDNRDTLAIYIGIFSIVLRRMKMGRGHNAIVSEHGFCHVEWRKWEKH